MFDSVEDEVVRCTDPPGPNSRTAIVVSADTEDAATAARPRERMDLMVYYLDVILLEGGDAGTAAIVSRPGLRRGDVESQRRQASFRDID